MTAALPIEKSESSEGNQARLVGVQFQPELREPRAAGLTMTYKLLRAAEATWRRLDGQELIPLVRAGVRFVDGKRLERDNEDINNEGTKKVRKAAA